MKFVFFCQAYLPSKLSWFTIETSVEPPNFLENCYNVVSAWSSFIWTRTIWTASTIPITIESMNFSVVMNHRKKAICHSKICVAFFWVIYLTSIHLALFCSLMSVSGLLAYSLHASGGNNIEDLASVDSLNSFPKLVVRFCYINHLLCH